MNSHPGVPARVFKSDWLRFWEKLHEWPSPILVKFAPVVDFGLKVTHEPFFRVISLKNWVKWGSEGSNFGFLEKRVLGRSAEQEWFRTYLKSSKRPLRPHDRPRQISKTYVKRRPRCGPWRPRDIPYNAGFLNQHIERWFWHEPNACKISYKRVDFCCSVTLMSRETAVGSSRVFQYMSYYKKCFRLSWKIEQIWDHFYYKKF